MTALILGYSFVALATFLSLYTGNTAERWIKEGETVVAFIGCLIAAAVWPLLFAVKLLRLLGV
jgi:hypothetical protein